MLQKGETAIINKGVSSFPLCIALSPQKEKNWGVLTNHIDERSLSSITLLPLTSTGPYDRSR